MELKDRTILVTGAALRIGRALSLAFAREGADVILHYRSSQAAAQSAAEQIRALGRKAHTLQADLSDPAQVTTLFERAAAIGPLHALVNNASIFAPLDWDGVTLEEWERHLRVNLTAPFLLTQAFARALPPAESGRVLNLLDWRALRPGPDHLPYTVSKAGLAALTRSLAVALAPRITVNGLALGAILPANEGQGDAPAGEQRSQEIIRSVPALRWAGMEEVEAAAIFLLSGPAYITGEILHLDGGRRLV
ncbi:MAG: SDR family oxidoreductase [Anaerolineales bacterium]|nr:SDR family oxidoreductase [Anaerolineales bacterium]